MVDWYLLEPGRSPDGPLSVDALVKRIEAGSVSREATVCPAGENRWEPVTTVEPFARVFVVKETPLAALEVFDPFPLELEPDDEPSDPSDPFAAAATGRALPRLPPIGSAIMLTGAPLAAAPFAPREPPGATPPPDVLFAGPSEGPPPYQPSSAPPPRPGLGQARSTSAKQAALVAGGVGFTILLAVVLTVLFVRHGGAGGGAAGHDGPVKGALVRVTTPSGRGTGFFVAGPDELAYVATAYHVIDRGEPVLIERNVDISDKSYFVEAYPETEVVAFDADADLAVLRIKNVASSRFERLPLAPEPLKDAKILSYGYPASSLAKRAGLVSKDGKVLSLVKFPVYDRRYSRILRDNAIDGLLVSTDIEPGFSGGPTCNEAGEVVGVNVTKDQAHVGQNGAVSVTVLRQLLARIKPAKDREGPKPEDVAALLKQIQGEYLLLPLDGRGKVRETDFLSSSDLPALRRLVNEIRRHERNTDPSFIPKLHLSGQAALGIFYAKLPGKQLETYLSPATKTPIAECELSNQRLASFLEEIGKNGKPQDTGQKLVDSCDELAFRPLAWDLTAATLQWDGREKEYSVTKIDRLDDEGTAYRASVRMGGVANLVEIWVGADQGKLRLKLFDGNDNLYALRSPRDVPGSAFAGTWSVKSPRVTDASDKETDIAVEEKLTMTVEESHKVSIRHVVSHHYYVTSAKRGALFRCSARKEIETGLLQSFSGTLDNGVIIALPQKDAERVGADSGNCAPKYKADRVVALKLSGDQLYMYRTDGTAYPETRLFTKE